MLSNIRFLNQSNSYGTNIRRRFRERRVIRYHITPQSHLAMLLIGNPAN